jgi:hypothetical protein
MIVQNTTLSWCGSAAFFMALSQLWKSICHITENAITFLLQTPFWVILDFLKILFWGLSNPNKNKPKINRCKCCANVFLSCQHLCSVSLSTWDLSMIHIASPLIVRHTYTQDQENRTISTTWFFKAFICHFLISLHKGLQSSLSHLLSKYTLSMWLESFQHMWVQSMASSHILQWFDPQHNMTPHISISTMT